MILNDPRASLDDLDREIAEVREYRDNLIKWEDEALRKEERPWVAIIRFVGMMLTVGSVMLILRQGLTLEIAVVLAIGVPPTAMWIKSDQRKKDRAAKAEELNLKIGQLNQKRQELLAKR